MNRTLKFRIWDVKEKQFYQPNGFINEWPVLDMDGRIGMAGEFGEFRYSHDIKQEDFIIQQYTGLKDYEGKEIFEGDIVVCKFQMDWDDEREYEVIYLVKWCPIHVGFRGFTKEMLEKYSQYSGHGMPNPIKIIGNMFENPELLK